MCDAPGALIGYLTSIDMQNAHNYARMKILYNQSQNYKDKFVWVNTNSDGSSNYYCPKELDCKDGYVRIANKKTCQELSTFDKLFDSTSNYPDENANNGYYLEWRSPSNIDPSSKEADTIGQCYRASGDFRLKCVNGDFSGGSANPVPGLYYDNNSGRCFVTRNYCRNVGDLSYNPPNDSVPFYIKSKKDSDDDPGYGGSCELNTGQKISDFIFGDTITRGVFAGKCIPK